MRTFGKWVLRIGVMLVLAAVVVGFWQREQITRLLAVNSLFSEEKIVSNFSNMGSAFLNPPVSRGNGPTAELAYGENAVLPAQVVGWAEARDVTALVVLKDGEIVHESYYKGTAPEDLRISWSVAKSYLSALVGVLLEDGTIGSIDDPVVQYAPALKGGAYDSATIRNVLNMSSGVVFDEDYLDQFSDINRMGRVLALGGCMDDFASDLAETFARAGKGWKYVSIDTHILSMVVRSAAKRPIAELSSEKIIAPMGLEREPFYLTDAFGTAFVLGGLNLTTRDYARMGQMFLQNGQYNGQQIVPEAWVAASTVASAPTAEGEIGYGYQWWIPKGAIDGEFMARGIYGQYVYVNRARDVVIATNGADRNFRDEGVADMNVAIFRAIADGI